MGFVVERHVNTQNVSSSGSSSGDVVRKNQAVVYGKAEYMWSVSINNIYNIVNVGIISRTILCLWQGRTYVDCHYIS